MISLEFFSGRLRGRRAGIFGHAADGNKPSQRGRFQLFAETGDADESDPVAEGDSAVELEAFALVRGAVEVSHYYDAP